MDQVKAILMLHSGKIVEKHIPDLWKEDDESFFKSKEGVELINTEEKT